MVLLLKYNVTDNRSMKDKKIIVIIFGILNNNNFSMNYPTLAQTRIFYTTK